MKVTKKTTIAGAWAKKGVDIVNGDVITITNEGAIVSGDYGDREAFGVATKNGQKNLAFNQTSMNACIDAFGDATEKWVGQHVKTTIVKQNVAGKFIDVVYVSHPDWELGENGFFNPNAQKVGEDVVKVEDLPF